MDIKLLEIFVNRTIYCLVWGGEALPTQSAFDVLAPDMHSDLISEGL